MPPFGASTAIADVACGYAAKHVLPVVTDLLMRNKGARAERARWVPVAAGVILEVGAGSGLNFAHYGPHVRKAYGLDPSAELRRMAAPRAQRARVPIELQAAPAEAVPLSDGSVDTVVTRWTLCTIPDPARALYRILSPADLPQARGHIFGHRGELGPSRA